MAGLPTTETTPICSGLTPVSRQTAWVNAVIAARIWSISCPRSPPRAAWMRLITSPPKTVWGLSMLLLANSAPVPPSSKAQTTVVVPMSNASRYPGATGSTTDPALTPVCRMFSCATSGSVTSISPVTAVLQASRSAPSTRTRHLPLPPQGASGAIPSLRSASSSLVPVGTKISLPCAGRRIKAMPSPSFPLIVFIIYHKTPFCNCGFPCGDP